MMNIKELSALADPGFIEMNNAALNGGGTIHFSGELVIDAIRIGDGLYQIGRYIINEKGEIIGRQ